MEDTSADVFLPSARCARSSDFATFEPSVPASFAALNEPPCSCASIVQNRRRVSAGIRGPSCGTSRCRRGSPVGRRIWKSRVQARPASPGQMATPDRDRPKAAGGRFQAPRSSCQPAGGPANQRPRAGRALPSRRPVLSILAIFTQHGVFTRIDRVAGLTPSLFIHSTKLIHSRGGIVFDRHGDARLIDD